MTDESAPGSLAIASGASFTGLPGRIGRGLVVTNSAVKPFTAPGGLSILYLGETAEVKSSGPSLEMFDAPTSAFLAMLCAAGSKVGDGTNDVVAVGATSAYIFSPFGAGPTLKDNAISGAGAIQADGNNPAAIISQVQTNHSGSFSLTWNGGGAALVAYDPTAAGLDSVIVQDAIDEASALKHRTISTSDAITAADRNIGIVSLAGPIAPTLPASADVASAGKIWGCWFADEDGSASGVNTVTPTPTGPDSIVGTVTAINGAFGAIYVYTAGDGVWHVR
jgi:hypothetical protein